MCILGFDEHEEKRMIEILYEKYRLLMLKVAYDVLQDYNLSEDAVHNAFLKLFRHVDLIEDIESDRTKRLLITISKNAAIDMLRKLKATTGRDICIDNINEFSLSYDIYEAKNEIEMAFDWLPEIYKDIFLLKYSAGFDNKQIAEILGITQVNLRKRLSRGKVLLEKFLDGKV